MIKKLYFFLLEYIFFIYLTSFFLCIFIIIKNLNNFSFKKKNIFVLNSKKFNIDLNKLSSLKKYNLIKIPVQWQYRILSKWIYDVPRKTFFHNKKKNLILREKIKQNLEKIFFFTDVFFNFRAVLGASIHYNSDLDIGEYYSIKKIPYIIFHKEGFVVTKTQKKNLIAIYEKYKNLEADLVFVNNDEIKSIIKKTNDNKLKVISSGNPIYRNLTSIGNKTLIKRNNFNQTILLFSFHYRAGIFDKKVDTNFSNNGWKSFFYNVHKQFIISAKNNPNSNYIIKVKWQNNWVKKIKKIEKEVCGKKKLKNLKYTYYESSIGLIKNSEKIISFNSTAILEALWLGKVTICPDFSELYKYKFKNQIIHNNFKNLVHLSKTPNEFQKLLKTKSLEKKHINTGLAKKNFKKYVSKKIGNECYRCINKYINLILHDKKKTIRKIH